jgi:hypothetical protein
MGEISEMRLAATAFLLALPTGAMSFASPALAQAAPATYRGTLQGCPNGQQLELEANHRYTITATSDAFDPVLRIMRRGSSDVLVEDDDSGEGNSALLTFSPSESGDYVACVASFGSSGGGDYTVTVAPAAPLPAVVSRPTATEAAAWQVYEGRLASGDAQDGGMWFDDYQIVLEPGHRALISAESAAFDTLLKVYDAGRRGGEPIATDDDTGGGLNAFLVLAPPEGGSFVIRVTSFSAGAGGAYRLRVTDSLIPQQPVQTEDETHGE